MTPPQRPTARTSRGHLATTDDQGRILLFQTPKTARPVALTPDDLWELALRYLGEQEMVHRLNAVEAEQADRYKRDAFFWIKQRTRRDPRKETP